MRKEASISKHTYLEILESINCVSIKLLALENYAIMSSVRCSCFTSIQFHFWNNLLGRAFASNAKDLCWNPGRVKSKSPIGNCCVPG